MVRVQQGRIQAKPPAFIRTSAIVVGDGYISHRDTVCQVAISAREKGSRGGGQRVPSGDGVPSLCGEHGMDVLLQLKVVGPKSVKR